MPEASLKPQAQSDTPVRSFAAAAETLTAAVESRIVGQRETIRTMITCFVAGGHVLLEDRPGVGKSTLSKTFATALGLGFKRIQMTADLLPVDVLGGTIPAPGQAAFTPSFVFHKGPIFAPLVFVDELNRASPRTQSALLEAMEERCVTVDGKSHELPYPFFVLATQNPSEHAGTNPLPDSQLDRFLVMIRLGLPSRDHERLLLQGSVGDLKALVSKTSSSQDQETWRRATLPTDPKEARESPDPGPSDTTLGLYLAREGTKLISEVTLSAPVIDYILDLVAFTRDHCSPGLSPRASLGIARLTRAHALIQGRLYATPDDVKCVFPGVVRHRIRPEHLRSLIVGNYPVDVGPWILDQVALRI